MNRNLLYLFFLFFQYGIAQDISLLHQFNGHIDFTMIGNTLNPVENENASACTILTSASANLNLNPNDVVEAAYLYWAGSGTGDFDVMLNNQAIQAQRTFDNNYGSLLFFAAYADVTTQIQTSGNVNYTLSDLDLTSIIPNYCSSGVNFGGWSILIIYSNNTLPINQINVYDGMQSVPSNISIQLNNLNVIDNLGAKIGFLAWEGDSALAVNESLRINGNLIGNALNPEDNAFNGTNSFTGETNLYNMDMDYYDIENYIQIGDTSANIELTSGQDYVMVNCVVTKLNSQLPDAVTRINDYDVLDCHNRTISLDFNISNTQLATGSLSSNMPIAIYVNDILITTLYTQNEILVGESVHFSEDVTIPSTVTTPFNLVIVADDDGSGNGTVIESIEINNDDNISIAFPNSPPFSQPNNLLACNTGFQQAEFDLESLISQVTTNSNLEILFYTSDADLQASENEITGTDVFINTSNPQEIFIRINDPTHSCYSKTSVLLNIENCPLMIPDGFSPNDDNVNEAFIIQGLSDIFINYNLKIFNRYGSTVYEGNNNSNPWNGKHNGKELPVGTYFYTLNLNDGFSRKIKGWVYLMR